MRNELEYLTPLPKSIYTLAQTETPITVNGKGIELSNERVMKGRAKRKMITQKIALSLIKVTDEKGKKAEKKDYWNMFHCQNKLHSADGRLYGTYCKNRLCMICCRIRKANILNRYLSVIQTWEDSYFVTLTIKAIPAKLLKGRVKEVLAAFVKIVSKHRKRSQRGKGIKLMGIKAIECTFNPIKKSYNPHLHLIVPNKQTADILTSEWLEFWTTKYAQKKGQKSQRIKKNEADLIKHINYINKVFVEPDLKNKSRQVASNTIHVAALDNIYCAMKGCRIFDRFGFNLPKINKNVLPMLVEIDKYDRWEYDTQQSDWTNEHNGQKLCGYSPTFELQQLINGNIDISLE